MPRKHNQGRPSKGKYIATTLRIYEKDYPKLKKKLNQIAKIKDSTLNDTILDILYHSINKIPFNIINKLKEENNRLEQEIKSLTHPFLDVNKDLNILKNDKEKRKICIEISKELFQKVNLELVKLYSNSFGHFIKTVEDGLCLWLNYQKK